jgi:hypothetical protein
MLRTSVTGHQCVRDVLVAFVVGARQSAGQDKLEKLAVAACASRSLTFAPSQDAES